MDALLCVVGGAGNDPDAVVDREVGGVVDVPGRYPPGVDSQGGKQRFDPGWAYPRGCTGLRLRPAAACAQRTRVLPLVGVTASRCAAERSVVGFRTYGYGRSGTRRGTRTRPVSNTARRAVKSGAHGSRGPADRSTANTISMNAEAVADTRSAPTGMSTTRPCTADGGAGAPASAQCGRAAESHVIRQWKRNEGLRLCFDTCQVRSMSMSDRSEVDQNRTVPQGEITADGLAADASGARTTDGGEIMGTHTPGQVLDEASPMTLALWARLSC